MARRRPFNNRRNHGGGGRQFSGGGRGRMPNRMMMRLIVVAIAAIVGWFGKNKSDSPDQKTSNRPAGSYQQEGEFQVLTDCRIASSKYNDGDSFMVSYDGGQTEFRLYFVDTPESKDKPYDDHKKRVADQAKDMGGISYNQAIKLGQKAKDFTAKALKRPFTVYASGELVYGGPREYAFIQVSENGQKRWLHELLIENGLGRIHTKGHETPDGLSVSQQKSRLKKLQSQN